MYRACLVSITRLGYVTGKRKARKVKRGLRG